jgi:hypothetical protein
MIRNGMGGMRKEGRRINEEGMRRNDREGMRRNGKE